MIQRVMPFAVVLGAVVLSTTAGAQEPRAAKPLGEDGQVTLGVERVFGVSYVKQEGRDTGITTFSLFGPTGIEASTSPYSIPRFGIDYFAGGGFSLGVGGSFALASQGGDTLRVLGLNPRVGYAVSLSDGFALWPKVGINYVSYNEGGGDSRYIIAASVEAQFVASLSRQVGFTFTPLADIGVGGSRSNKLSQFGLQGGLLAWF